MCLANESEVEIAAAGIGDRRPTIGINAEGGAAGNVAEINRNRTIIDIANHGRAAKVQPAVDISDANRTAIGGSIGCSTVT